MPLDFSRARPLLQHCDLPKLFVEELGWEPCRQKHTLRVGETNYAFTAVGEKRGFTAWLCEAPGGALPDHATRLKLDRLLAETSFEHLIVFATGDRSRQSWMWVRREPNKPLAARTHEYHQGQPGDSLLQKLQLLYVSLAEEEAGLSTVAVAGRARAAFDVERVTKAFYRDFDTHRKAFLKFIEGIAEVADREWYASVMLNRLMFVYFIQRKGFLDGDHDYLRNRLRRCQQTQGKDQFYPFYRYFLLRLFHEGFSKRRKDRAPDLEKLLGNIPYLNGGLFDVHELERPDRYGKSIQIPDGAFERVFDYFDQYQWHLDERPLRADNEINPDVLGYIFEKYINQKQMGAYYTKEDITEYIGKNTILPFLFDAARKECKVAFDGGSSRREEAQTSNARNEQSLVTSAATPTVWDLLRENPDRYIYPAVRHGTEHPLPPDIAAGVNDVSRRTGWNKPAPGEFALPTETWREVVARRTRCEELRKKLLASGVHDISDLITLNLDIRQFAQDVIARCEGPDLLRALWHAVERVTILDPTCGSGAFLFAALNLLEPLYEACLDRMESFLEDEAARHDRAKLRQTEHGLPLLPHRKFEDFSLLLDRVAAHPNRRYFVFKSIILNNLFGVDLMEEAVEICKLRLFLKLAAQVEPDARKDNLGIEPLPDIDFNIRAGNTLVGYANQAELEAVAASDWLLKEEVKRVLDAAGDAASLYQCFLKAQVEGDQSPAEFKRRLREKFSEARSKCDGFLAESYQLGLSKRLQQLASWRASHHPFHWFVEFHDIAASGGFDVIVGNPPYVEYSKVKQDYSIRRYETGSCGNLYAYVIERSFAVLKPGGRMGMIVPLSLTFSRDFVPLRSMLLRVNGHLQMSSYDNIPDRLFTGAKESDNTSKANQQRITIFTLHNSQATPRVEVTPILRWKATERWRLFGELPLANAGDICTARAFPKVGSAKMKEFLVRWEANPQRLASLLTDRSKHSLVVPKTAGYYIAAYPDEMERTQQTCISFRSSRDKDLAMTLLNSNAFFWLWRVYGDSFHVTSGLIGACPVFAQNDGEFLAIAKQFYGAIEECTVHKGYRGVKVPNVNFNKRMDLLWQADEWIIRNVAPDLGVTPEDFLWGKSNSFFKLQVPKSANFPDGCDVSTTDTEDED